MGNETPTNDAPVTVEQMEMQAHRLDRIREDNDKPTLTDRAALRETADMLRRLAALASASAGDGVTEEAARAYFERGFMACYAWQYVNKAAQLSDAVIDHAWDNREEGGELPALARPRAAVGEREV